MTFFFSLAVVVLAIVNINQFTRNQREIQRLKYHLSMARPQAILHETSKASSTAEENIEYLTKQLTSAWKAIGEDIDRRTHEILDNPRHTIFSYRPWPADFRIDAARRAGPAFRVEFKETPFEDLKSGTPAGWGEITISPHPSVFNGLRTESIVLEDGSYIIDPTSEPAWITEARHSSCWRVIEADRVDQEGRISLSFEPLF